MPVTRTEFIPSVIPAETATFAYDYFRNNIDWKEGIKSRKGFTRMAKSMSVDEDEVVQNLIQLALERLKDSQKNKINTAAIFGVYLNYYRDGQDWTPPHSHPGSSQLIVSLGGKRTLNIGKKNYVMGNGDIALFGSATHGVPKEETKDGRISVAVFCKFI